MEVVVAAIVVVFIGIMGFKAVQAYPGYKGSLYQQLFSGYLEYFWKYTMKENLSQSSLLTAELGEHRLTYNAYFDSKGTPVAQFTTVFSLGGHTSICAMHTSGAVSGADTGSWSVERDGKRFALASPVSYIRKQRKFLDGFLKGKPVAYVVAFDDGVDLSGVSCSYPVMHVSEVVAYLKSRAEEGVTEHDVLQAFDSFKERAQHAR